MVKLVSVGRAKKAPKIEIFGLKVYSLGPRGDPHMRPRGNPHGTRGNLLLARFLSLRVASILGVFLALLTRTSFTTPHYYPKYEVWAIEIFLWYDPFK